MSGISIFYIITHPAFPGWCSIGVTSNIKGRMQTYRTHTPDRSFKLEYFAVVDDVYALESFIKHLCKSTGNTNGYEWVSLPIEYIKGAVSAFMYRLNTSKERDKYVVFIDTEQVGEFDYLKEISREMGIPYHQIKKIFNGDNPSSDLSHIQIEKVKQ